MSKIPFLASPVIASVLLSTSSARLNVGDEKKLKENVRVIDGHVMGIIPTPSNVDVFSRGMPVERNIAVASIIAARHYCRLYGMVVHLLGERGKNPSSVPTSTTPDGGGYHQGAVPGGLHPLTAATVPAWTVDHRALHQRHIFPDGTFRLGEDALEFKPERFIDNETTLVRVSALFIETKIVIASIVARFEMIPNRVRTSPTHGAFRWATSHDALSRHWQCRLTGPLHLKFLVE
ncbi:hypothetical protein GQ600_26863 [Phytophthora cactorum]|nr:hypothetical protein GQ600_26863 [Phytophthora cactorum]